MMNHHEIQDRLSDFADAALPAGEQREVAAHLEECGECRLEVEAFRTLRAEARALPRGVSPSRDLWPGIAARIAPAARPRVIAVDFRAPAPRPWRQWGLAAAAAVALVVLSSAITARVVGGGGAGPVATLPAERVLPGAEPDAALAAFRPAEAQYLSTAEQLAAELEARRHLLAPETVAVIEENLRIIDQAIQEARTALERDPSSAELPLLLADVYRQKVELLQKAVQLPART